MFHNGIYICISWYRKICRFPVKNEYVSRTQEVSHEICKLFGSFWGKYNCIKFRHCRICVIYFREEELFDPTFFHHWAALKRPILNRINLPIYILLTLSKKNMEQYLLFQSYALPKIWMSFSNTVFERNTHSIKLLVQLVLKRLNQLSICCVYIKNILYLAMI